MRGWQESTAHDRGWGPSVLGACAAALGLGGSVALSGAAVRGWPGLGTVAASDATTGVLLPLAALLTLWVTTVVARAAWQVRPDGGDAGRGASSRPVRLVSAVLISVAGGLAAPVAAQASAPTAVMVAVADAGPAEPAPASPSAPAQRQDPPPADDQQVEVPVPGWTPTSPTPTGRVAAEVGLVSGTSGAAGRSVDGPGAEVTVRQGDTLWDIAARHLGHQATDTDVAEEWPRWYAANRDLIGPDPDLIQPGQLLLAPPAEGRDG